MIIKLYINKETQDIKSETQLRKEFDVLSLQVIELGLEFNEWLDVEEWGKI